jgi:hypothetical protein
MTDSLYVLNLSTGETVSIHKMTSLVGIMEITTRWLIETGRRKAKVFGVELACPVALAGFLRGRFWLIRAEMGWILNKALFG